MSFRARRGSAAVADAGKSAPAPHARSSWFGGGGGGAPARERDTSPTAPARRASGPPANAPPAPPFRPFAIAGGDELLLGPRLGTGGFASVHAATWRGGPVAAKLIAPRPATALALLGAGAAAGGGGSGGGGARADDATSAERAALAARREAEVLGMLRHPNVVALYALAPPSTLVMELCTGGSLASKLGASTLPTLGWGPRLELAAGIAAALEFVHTSGIVHLDIKSANVVLTPLAGGGSLPKLWCACARAHPDFARPTCAPVL